MVYRTSSFTNIASPTVFPSVPLVTLLSGRTNQCNDSSFTRKLAFTVSGRTFEALFPGVTFQAFLTFTRLPRLTRWSDRTLRPYQSLYTRSV